MAESFTTCLKWHGSLEVGQQLAGLIPEGINSKIVEGDSAEDEAMVTLVIDVEAESLEELRIVVDDLLTLFSDQDE